MQQILRFICPAIAGLVAVMLSDYDASAVNRADFAALAEKCTPADYSAYTDALHSNQIEGAPHELLQISHAFLTICPERPEARRVALTAARNALDSGEGQRALGYFDMARKLGADFPHQSRMDYITALILNDKPDLAWRLRDWEIEHWLQTTAEDGLASVETRRVRDGLIHKLVFDAVDPAQRVRTAWMAVPHEGGFPATISLQSEPAIIALKRIIKGPAAEGLEEILLNRCHGRDTLHSSLTGLEDGAAEQAATAIAKAYLANPDMVGPSRAGQPIATCFETDRLFVAPDPSTAVPVY